ncbi:MAG: GGDEF domain-containing protein, partial [Oscillospiraceae bacterium]|nr:GGDEF domain-containing protein [Oscillospiraceae bacterium]
MKKFFNFSNSPFKYGHFLLLLTALIVVVFLSFLGLFQPGPSVSFKNEDVLPFNTGWSLLSSYGEEAVTLPAQISGEPGQPVTITRVLSADFQHARALRLRCSQQSLKVFLDGEPLYSFGTEEISPFHSLGSFWQIIQLPPQSAGKKLTITLTSPYAIRNGRLNEISMGASDALMLDVFYTYLSRFALSVLILLLGLLLAAFYLIFKFLFSIQNPSLLYLGAFGVFASLWLLGESRMLQFFIDSPLVINISTFLGLAAFPIPLNLYFGETCGQRAARFFRGAMLVQFFYFILSFLLQLCGVCDFFQLMPVQQALLGANLIFASVLLLYEAVSKRNKQAKRLLPALSLLALCGLAELVLFYFVPTFETARLFRIGILGFLLLLTIRSIQVAYQLISRGQEATYYERLANTDVLTRGYNRTAYEEDLAAYESGKKPLAGLCCILFDLNDLKYINDRFGHACGDEALKKAFSCIKRA